MTDFAYTPPSVSISELITPSVAPIFDRPTSIAIVGETQGYLSYTETLLLVDETPVIFKQSGVDLTSLVVKDGLNPLKTYTVNTDYVISSADASGYRTIRRNLYTNIPTDTDIAYVATVTGPSATVTGITSLAGNSGRVIDFSPAYTGVSAVVLQSLGRFVNTTDYTVVGGGSATLTRVGGGSIVSGQTVYVTYTTASGANSYSNVAVTLSSTTPAAIPNASESVDTASVIVSNRPTGVVSELGSGITTYSEGASADFTKAIVTSVLTLTRVTSGPTTIGAATNAGSIKVTYNATPTDYYYPRRYFSQADVESKYGPALDAAGNVSSAASFGSYMAFTNGATDVTIQPLFHVATLDVLTGTRSKPTHDSYLTDWEAAFQSLRDVEDINLIVPCFHQTAASGTITDSTVLSIFAKLQSHIHWQFLNQQQVCGILGEDGTIPGNGGLLRAHAGSLASSGTGQPERVALVSPSIFSINNPAGTGRTKIGGQYMAAAIAGMAAARTVQTPLTRKTVLGVNDVVEFRSELDKNGDAASGLMVVENKNGTVRVRHAITTAVNDLKNRELSVVRAKLFMVESIRATIDNGIVGQIVADNNAAFTVTAAIAGVLEHLVATGVIVDYAGIQAKFASCDPTKLIVTFSYKPAFPLNYVDISFSIDTSSQTVTVQGA